MHSLKYLIGGFMEEHNNTVTATTVAILTHYEILFFYTLAFIYLFQLQIKF